MATPASASTQPKYFKNYAQPYVQPYPTQYSNNGMTISGGGGGGYNPKKKIEELEAQFLESTNPNKIAATNSEYGMAIATNPYRTQEQISRSQLSTAQTQSGMRLQPMQERADYGGLRNKSFGQDATYSEGFFENALKQSQRADYLKGLKRDLARYGAGDFEHPDKARGVKYAKGQFDTAEQRQDVIERNRRLVAAYESSMAANPYQYQAPTATFDNSTKKGYYK